ncbi:hypothetical protein LCGC14_0870140 [marine sediment metagenome]|uniref:DUF1156 domain-containing protein n=1 Tax=marine sediment metagenome TaxID=412755 RepID=A0A0F9P9T0_9ZZZZ
MDNDKRLIDDIFPLLETNMACKKEIPVTQKHPRALHVWPARMVLAASRAVLIATLLKSPKSKKKKKELSDQIGSILRWKSEFNETTKILRKKIIEEYGVPPKIIDFFAGSGSIILEALRMGGDCVASDLNPVAWLIEKCTLEFPFLLSEEKIELPKKRKTLDYKNLTSVKHDLASHVDFWQNWVFKKTKNDLIQFFPKFNDNNISVFFWARTVPCEDPSCKAKVPLVKMMKLNNSKNNKITRKLVVDKKNREIKFEVMSSEQIEKGTVEGAKAFCPLHPTPIGIEDVHIKNCGKNNMMDYQLTAIRMDNGNYYSPPDYIDIMCNVDERLKSIENEIPFGIPKEKLEPSLGYRVQLYGMDRWDMLFTNRQMLAILTFLKYIRKSINFMKSYPKKWKEAIMSYLATILDKFVNRMTTLCIWNTNGTKIEQTLAQNTLPIVWDFPESNPFISGSGSWESAAKYVIGSLKYLLITAKNKKPAKVLKRDASDLSSFSSELNKFDLVFLDPPYYNAIGYAGLSDLFYIFARRILFDVFPEVFKQKLSPKDNEIIMYSVKGIKTKDEAKAFYQEKLTQAFKTAHEVLKKSGRMVVVFAQKDPEAWISIIEAIINTGFVVTSSWPIQTSKKGGRRNFGRSSLGSTIWIVCKKRLEKKIGDYRSVMKELKDKIKMKLRTFWDNGIVGPDLLWAAVGPALESYSLYDTVEKAGGSEYTVNDFLKEVRKLTSEFVLYQVLHEKTTEKLDDITRYYLIHRQNFEFSKAPDGECILLAQGLNLELNILKKDYNILEGSSGSGFKLISYEKRKKIVYDISYDAPLIDKLHQLMIRWKSGDINSAAEMVETLNLQDDDLFWTVAQAICEMIEDLKDSERILLEGLLNWGRPGIKITTPKKQKAIDDYVKKTK